MKTFSVIQTVIIVLAAACISVLLMMNEADNTSLTKKVAGYQRKADSLKGAMIDIDNHIRNKDSILLVYLSSLDRTLEELNKESAKNRSEIARNLAQQDSVREAYCREMARLQQDPTECQ